MTLTNDVCAELVTVPLDRTSAASELATIIRLAGSFEHGSQLTLTIACSDPRVLKRVSVLLHEELLLNGRIDGDTLVVSDNVAPALRKLGLITRGGTPVRGLPMFIVNGSMLEAEAAWRGAFLVAGTLMEPGRSSSLDIQCPCQEVALALVGCGRRLNFTVKSKDVRGSERAVIKDEHDIGALLTRLGASRTRIVWEEELKRRQKTTANSRLANFDDANMRRSVQAAIAASAKVSRALEILGDDVPDHLAEAGHLRITYQQASLEELGKLADPQMTKDAIAGRIRRLLTTADRRAKELGIPPTSEALKHLDEEPDGFYPGQ